jgi:hypothetical protein
METSKMVEREVNERYGVARGTPGKGGTLPTVGDVAEPDRSIVERDPFTGETSLVGVYTNPMRVAFRADRPVTTHAAPCRFCGTECASGQAVVLGKGKGVSCAACNLAWQRADRSQGSYTTDDIAGTDTRAPVGWNADRFGRPRLPLGATVTGRNLHRPASVASVAPVPVFTGPTPRAGSTLAARKAALLAAK